MNGKSQRFRQRQRRRRLSIWLSVPHVCGNLPPVFPAHENTVPETLTQWKCSIAILLPARKKKNGCCFQNHAKLKGLYSTGIVKRDVVYFWQLTSSCVFLCLLFVWRRLILSYLIRNCLLFLTWLCQCELSFFLDIRKTIKSVYFRGVNVGMFPLKF